MSGYPEAIAQRGRTEPVPRRIRAMVRDRMVLDTTEALYLWEWPFYPRYLIPAADVERDAFPAKAVTDARTDGYVRVDWDAADRWFEEDEEVFVHPRNPYVRVDALRSNRAVRVELEGVVLAETAASVMVFETGLPTRHYLDRTAVNFKHLRPSDTVTPCPYKGRTSQYWSVQIGDQLHDDLAWTYDYPTRQLATIAGLVAFYDEKVDTFVDGVEREQPKTHFFDD